MKHIHVPYPRTNLCINLTVGILVLIAITLFIWLVPLHAHGQNVTPSPSAADLASLTNQFLNAQTAPLTYAAPAWLNAVAAYLVALNPRAASFLVGLVAFMGIVRTFNKPLCSLFWFIQRRYATTPAGEWVGMVAISPIGRFFHYVVLDWICSIKLNAPPPQPAAKPITVAGAAGVVSFCCMGLAIGLVACKQVGAVVPVSAQVQVISSVVEMGTDFGVATALKANPGILPVLQDVALGLNATVTGNIVEPAAIQAKINSIVPSAFQSLVNNAIGKALTAYTTYYNANIGNLTATQVGQYVVPVLAALSNGLNAAIAGTTPAGAAGQPTSDPLDSMTPAQYVLRLPPGG